MVVRHLASIRKIDQILPIEGKDRIVLAIVDGWSVIVRKDDFSPGDLCVYIEIDSVLPEKPEFEFLRSKNFRIKTMKMAGCISSGICFPLSILPIGDYHFGDDVTNVLGVKQYTPTMDTGDLPAESERRKRYPRFLMRMAWFRRIVLKKCGNTEFPSFLRKTDETRIQNIPHVLDDREKEWIATEKIDGQSGTFALRRIKSKIPFVRDRFEYIVCSRNRRLPHHDSSSYWSVSDKYHIESVLREFIGENDYVYMQGEVVGPRIQGNKYNLREYDLYVFNVGSEMGRLDSVRAKLVCVDRSMNFVPILEKMRLPETVDKVLQYAHGKSAIGDTLREGVVFRSLDGRDSFKAVDPLYLIKYDE